MSAQGLMFLFICFATFIVNASFFYYDPIHLWVRVTFPIIMIFGMYGTISGGRFFRWLGWLGIGVFILCGLEIVFPGEDYISGGPEGPALAEPRIPSLMETAIRLTVIAFVTIGLIYIYSILGKLKMRS